MKIGDKVKFLTNEFEEVGSFGRIVDTDIGNDQPYLVKGIGCKKRFWYRTKEIELVEIKKEFSKEGLTDAKDKLNELWKDHLDKPIMVDNYQINMLRQWINEQDPDEMITNEDIIYWLRIK